MLKILQARLQQYVNCELPVVQAGFRKGRGTRDQIANICCIIEKAREFQKNIYFCFTDYAKAFVWITINCGKFWKRWEYQTIWRAAWEICIQVKKQQLELDMEQFFCIAFLRNWNENWPFPIPWHYWVFKICWHIECSTFTASSFRIWNSSTGISYPPLALFVVMLPKAHLPSHSRMSGSRWVITPSWLSGSWRSFFL